MSCRVLRRAPSRVAPILLGWALAAVVPAQATLRVPSQYATPQQALAVASPGDTVLLETPGPHERFDLSLGVTVRGAQPGTIVGRLLAPGVCSIRVPAGQVARLERLHFAWGTALGGTSVQVLGGTLSVAACRFEAPFATLGASGAFVVRNADVAATECDFVGTNDGFPAIHVVGGRLSLADCRALGGAGHVSFIRGAAPAVLLEGGSSLQMTGSQLWGGDDAGFRLDPAGAGLQLVGSTAWVSDSKLSGGTRRSTLTRAGHGIDADPQSRATIDAVQLVPGPGGGGLPSVGPVAVANLVRSGRSPSVLSGTQLSVVARMAPGAPVVLMGSPLLQAAPLPGVDAPIWLGVSNATVLDAGSTGAAGWASLSFSIAAVPPGPAWLQLVALDPASGRILVSPAFGGRRE